MFRSFFSKNFQIHPLFKRIILLVFILGFSLFLIPNWSLKLLIALVFGILIIFYINRISEALENLTESIRQSSQPNPDERLLLKRGNFLKTIPELKNIANAFEELINTLAEREKNLYHSKEHLEILNQELIQINEDLEKTTSELKETNCKLSASLQAKKQFLAHLSHEFRTPLNAILGHCEILLDGLAGSLEPKQIQKLQRIKERTNDLIKLVNELLLLSRLEAGKLELYGQELNLQEFLPPLISSIEPLIGEREIHFKTIIADNLPPIYADPDKFRQIILNLLSNAIKFTAQGCITIQATCKAAETLPRKALDKIPSLPNENFKNKISYERTKWVEISVSDPGVGIPEGEKQKIFEEFVRLNNQPDKKAAVGAGLGLNITRRLVEMHGGHIWVESPSEKGGSTASISGSTTGISGKGSTFIFTLPVINSGYKNRG